MEVIEFPIAMKHNDSVEYRFYPLGDIHYGSIECAEHDIERMRDKCLNDPYGYALGMGDYAECITKNDPRFDSRNVADWVEKDNIVECQRQKVNDLFRPLVKEHKLIGLLTGNHEEEIHMRHDNDIIRNICSDIGATYGGYQCFINIRFARKKANYHSFLWHAWHGAGSAQTEGARLMRLMRLVNDIEADIYSMGHIHGAITSYTPDRLIYNSNTHKIQSMKIIATLSGSWVKNFMQSTEERPLNPHYGEKKGYKPSRIGCPIIHIRPYRNDVWLET